MDDFSRHIKGRRGAGCPCPCCVEAKNKRVRSRLARSRLKRDTATTIQEEVHNMRKVGDTVWFKIEADNPAMRYDPFYNPEACVVPGTIRAVRSDGTYDVVFDHPAIGPACTVLAEIECLSPETERDNDDPCG